MIFLNEFGEFGAQFSQFVFNFNVGTWVWLPAGKFDVDLGIIMFFVIRGVGLIECIAVSALYAHMAFKLVEDGCCVSLQSLVLDAVF